MRPTGIIILILCVLIFYNSQAVAFWWDKKEEPKGSVEVQQEAPKAPQVSSSQAARRALKEKKAQQLNNTEWQVEMLLLGDKKKQKKDTDVLTFQNNQFSSGNFSRRGFLPTNYTVTIQEDGQTFVWETMQSSPKGGVAFWRGEIDGTMEKMQGILSHHVSDKLTQDYSFVTTGKRKILPSSEE